MSDAAGVSDSRVTDAADGDDFSRALARAAVSQVCESAGFQSAHRSALHTFADIAIRFISGLGTAAGLYANLAGRTDCTVFDVIQGLEDLQAPQGFGSASDAHHCPAGSGIVRELIQYATTSEEEAFAWPVPRYPVARDPRPIPSFAVIGEAPPKHIPDWLPAFPDPHTYIHTPAFTERAPDVRAAKVEQARQQKRAERSLLNLHRRLGWDGAVGSDDVSRGKRAVRFNLFLAEPLPHGEKEVSEVVVREEEKKVSVLEAFAPVIEAAKNGSWGEGSMEKLGVANNRPTVRFKMGVDKKSVAGPVNSKIPGGRTNSVFLRDDDKDVKKRRIEMIIKESMENPEELAQK